MEMYGVEIKYVGNEEGTTIEYSLDNTSWNKYNQEITISENKTIYVRIMKNGEIIKTAQKTIDNIDKQAPIVNANINETTITIDITEDESGLANNNKYEFYLSDSSVALTGGNWRTYYAGNSIELDTLGTKYVFIRKIKDNVGNTSISLGTEVNISGESYLRFGPFVLEAEELNITVTGPNEEYIRVGREVTYQITLNRTATLNKNKITLTGEGSTGCTVDVTGSGTTYTVTVTGGTGNGEIILNIEDGAFVTSDGKANTLVTKTGLKIDNTPPASFNISTELVEDTTSIIVSGETTDEHSGIAGYKYSSDNGTNWTETTLETSYTFTNLIEGNTYYFKMKAIDNLGNEIESNTATVTIPLPVPIPIPEGYVASEVEGENTIEDGLVIYEGTDPVTESNHATALTTRNQYVWIPVDDINDMVMCESNSGSSVCNLVLDGETLKCTTHPSTATDLVGRLYISTNFNDKSQSYNSEYKEPAVASTDQSNNITIESMKSDFTAMATSVAKNGGFYVSRYEIGANASSKKMQTVLTAGTNNGGAGNWYGLYNACKDLNENRQMIWGCQYDQMIKFIGEQAQIGHSDRNLTKTQALSGQNELDKMNNIYDLEGNSLEWILESRENYRTERGNSFLEASIGTYNPASSRTYNDPGAGWAAASTRSTLYIGLEGKTIPVPEGYVASEVEGENTKEDGLVIYEGTEPVTEENHATALTTRNQYVWIPVDDINDMVMCSSNSGNSVCNLVLEGETLKCTTHSATATNLVGRLYTSTNVNNGSGIYSYTMDFSKRDQIFKENDGNREPAILTGNGSQYDGNSNYLTILAGMPSGSTTSDFLEQQKSDFTAMATSVAKNGGFYISRYETGKDGESKKGQEVLTAASNSSGGYLAGNTWYGLYYNLRNINANQQMIWGCQYDQMIKFLVEGGEEAYIGHNNRNLAKSPALSGSNNLDKMKNIYDLEGNFSEWTQEANSNNVRVSRGSDLVSTNTNTFNSVSGRGQYGEPSQAGGTYTSRRTLYI